MAPAQPLRRAHTAPLVSSPSSRKSFILRSELTFKHMRQQLVTYGSEFDCHWARDLALDLISISVKRDKRQCLILNSNAAVHRGFDLRSSGIFHLFSRPLLSRGGSQARCRALSRNSPANQTNKWKDKSGRPGRCGKGGWHRVEGHVWLQHWNSPKEPWMIAAVVRTIANARNVDFSGGGVGVAMWGRWRGCWEVSPF